MLAKARARVSCSKRHNLSFILSVHQRVVTQKAVYYIRHLVWGCCCSNYARVVDFFAACYELVLLSALQMLPEGLAPSMASAKKSSLLSLLPDDVITVRASSS